MKTCFLLGVVGPVGVDPPVDDVAAVASTLTEVSPVACITVRWKRAGMEVAS